MGDPTAHPTSSPRLILAFDFGTRRIGVAAGDTLTRTARGLITLECRPDVPWPQIDSVVREYPPARVLVGLPYNMDGTETALSGRCRAFAEKLSRRYAIPVELVDERLSSREAQAQLRQARALGAKRRRVTHADVDQVAAKVLIERWYEQPQPPAC